MVKRNKKIFNDSGVCGATAYLDREELNEIEIGNPDCVHCSTRHYGAATNSLTRAHSADPRVSSLPQTEVVLKIQDGHSRIVEMGCSLTSARLRDSTASTPALLIGLMIVDGSRDSLTQVVLI